jgi:hypothetical protein
MPYAPFVIKLTHYKNNRDALWAFLIILPYAPTRCD